MEGEMMENCSERKNMVELKNNKAAEAKRKKIIKNRQSIGAGRQNIELIRSTNGSPTAKRLKLKESNATMKVGEIDKKSARRFVWNGERVIRLLKSTISYIQDGRSLRRTNEFIEFISSSLKATIDKDELARKLSHLKAQYEKKALMEVKGTLVFNSVYEEDVYDMSKVIWKSMADENGDDVEEEKGKEDSHCDELEEDEIMIVNGASGEPNGSNKKYEVAELDLRWVFQGHDELCGTYIRRRLSLVKPSLLQSLIGTVSPLRIKILENKVKLLQSERELTNLEIAKYNAI